MSLIRRGFQIGQAVKNVQRLRQIVSVFARHGFADIFDRIELGRFVPRRRKKIIDLELEEPVDAVHEKTTPERLRISFEELGPAFIKLGQILSTRPDLLPEAYIQEFAKLQEHVAPISIEKIKAVIEAELGAPVDHLFADFESVPLGSASIAQVHGATLLTGERVVVKVQRPDIRKVIETDTSLLEFLARLLERYVPEAQIIGPVGLVEEFTRTIMLELDFNVEANNVQKCAKNLAVFEDIVLPKVYKKFTSSKVLTLERLQGERYTDFAALDRLGTNRSAIVVLGARALFKSVLVDGLFHADLHGGNLFVLPGNKLGIIDFGMVGRLSQKSRGIFANMLVSILTEDYENLCYQYAELGDGSGSINFQKFQRDVQNLIAPYMGLSAREVNTARVLLESTRVAARYQIRIPGDWMLLIKSLVTIEGMGRVLDPDFDLLQLSDEFVGTLVKNQFSAERIGKDFLWAGKDLLALSRDLPRQIRWMFRKFNSDDFAFEIKIPQLDKIRKQLEVTEKRSSLTLLASALLVGSSIAMSRSSTEALAFGLPGLSLFFIGAAALILFRLFWFK